MADQTLILLAQEIRGKTLRILETVTENEAHFAAPGLVNTILWHAGHVLVVNEHLGVSAVMGREPQAPPGYYERFSWQSQPATVTSWPALDEVVKHLEAQLRELTSGLQALPDSRLDEIIGDPSRRRTLRYRILHGLHDEACHQGESWLLRKQYAKRQQA